ncbi:MAG: AraC family transcriptional regulator [Armatimonas sp.]
MDILSEMTSLIRTRGQVYGRLEFIAPWGFAFPGEKGICLIVTQGSCFLGVDGKKPLIPLTSGDFILLAAPQTYSLQSQPGLPIRPMTEIISQEAFHQSRLIPYQGDPSGASTTLIAGCFSFATPESEWLARSLPPILHVASSSAHSPSWFQSTLEFLDAEIARRLPGSDAVVDRLAEVLFVQALRTLPISPNQSEEPGWLYALADPQLGEALRLIHTEPEHSWTVPELARRVSMSRSAFAARFRNRVGKTPMEHLTEWRMVRAAGMIREGRAEKLAVVAAAVGYDSEAAFSKVFRRIIGVSPGKYRQQR